MKRLFSALLFALVLVGAGCSRLPGNAYRNEQYGFAMVPAEGHEMRVRGDAVRESSYVGLPVDFFASLRDLVRDAKPTNIAYFYAAKDMTVASFSEALVASGEGIEIVSTEQTKLGSLEATKIESTTQAGEPKYHYLVPVKDAMLIVSVFIGESDAFDAMADSFTRL